MRITRYSGKRLNRERFTALMRATIGTAPHVGTIDGGNVYFNHAGKPRAAKGGRRRKR